MVWQKYGTRKTATDAAGYVNDADSEGAGKFLKIPHDKVLEHHRDDELQQPVFTYTFMCKINTIFTIQNTLDTFINHNDTKC